jgi:hypothetical protein
MPLMLVLCNVRKVVVICCFCFFKINALSQDFLWTSECQKAYQSFLSMKIEEGKLHLLKEITTHQNNLLPYILINYEDFVTLSFNENPIIYKQRRILLGKRLQRLENGDKLSPYFLFCKALLHFQWSIIKLKHSDYWDAAWDFRKSFLLFKENKEKFPSFAPNNIFIGTQEAIISTIPKGYKWVSNLLGLKGNMLHGMNLLKLNVFTKDELFKEEANFYFVYLKNYLENDQDEAAKFIKEQNLDLKNNQLYSFMAANIALNNKNAQLTEKILNNRTKEKCYMDFPMLEYEMGCAKLRRLDFSAEKHFSNFLTAYKGYFYVKDAYYHIAICQYLQGNTYQAKATILKLKESGKTESDADKQAQKFAIKGTFPNKELLKIRLLNDGGNNDLALKYLVAFEKANIFNEDEKLEFYYRLARVCDDLGQDDNALINYNKTIELGKNSTEYYAARAALQCGYIYEKRKNVANAKRCFQKVLDIDHHEFKNSLDQRAKAALNRL